MNERIVRVLMSVRASMGERMLSDYGLVGTQLALRLRNKFPGERHLLLLLLNEGIPRRAAAGELVSEEIMRALATELAQTHFLDPDMTYRGLLTWQHVMRADETTAREGRVDEDFLRLLDAGLKATIASLPARPAVEEPAAAPMLPERVPWFGGKPPSGSRWKNSLGMEFALIPAGVFQMSSPPPAQGNGEECPLHRVRISRAFYLGRHPVTQSQWEAVMGNNPSRFKGPNRPVESVSWEDAQEFIMALNRRENCRLYRLPTEAEWEYAARAGTVSRYFFGERAGVRANQYELSGFTRRLMRQFFDRLDRYAWYADNAGETHPVGQKEPNRWGLHDLYGNVWEWCQDWYHDFYGFECGDLGRLTVQQWWDENYGDRVTDDPRGPISGISRVLRGGSWNNDAEVCRSASRGSDRPNMRSNAIGFRLAITTGPALGQGAGNGYARRTQRPGPGEDGGEE